MKKTFLILTLASLATAALAAEINSTPEQAEAKYTAAIEGRTADILKVLALTDAGKTAKVHDAIIAQYRALNAWHEENDARLVHHRAVVVRARAVPELGARERRRVHGGRDTRRRMTSPACPPARTD